MTDPPYDRAYVVFCPSSDQPERVARPANSNDKWSCPACGAIDHEFIRI